MIALLRLGAFLLNLVVPAGAALLLGLGWAGAVASPALLLALSWWACGLAPPGEDAPAMVLDAAASAARRMGAPTPRRVKMLPGWTAAAVRAGRGYVLLLGEDVEARHREAILAHEIAHYVNRDLFWEPLTDGPARLLLPAVRKVPPLVCALFPFLLLAVPLAKATELRADRRAAERMPSYPLVLKEVAATVSGRETVLYPSLLERIRRSARHSS